MKKRWEGYQSDEEQVKKIAVKNGISLLLAQILLNRGIDSDEKVKKFLHPDINDLYDPFLFKDMEIAVDSILESIKNNEHITIYGNVCH